MNGSGVDIAILLTPRVINQLIHEWSFCSKSLKDNKSQTVRTKSFKFWQWPPPSVCHMTISNVIVTCHVSHVRGQVLHVSCRMSTATPKLYELGRINFGRRFTSSHLSGFTCRMSHVQFIYSLHWTKCEAIRWRVCYQRGPSQNPS